MIGCKMLLVRRCVIVFVWLVTSACNGSTTGPSSTGTVRDISGAWIGTLTSSNNPTEQIVMNLSQSAARIEGTWRGELVNWTGQVTGDVIGSSFSGQMTFRGTASDQTVCTGTASIAGSASATSMSWSSTNGFVGDPCPAPRPVAIRIDLRR